MKTSRTLKARVVGVALASALLLTACNDDGGAAEFNTPHPEGSAESQEPAEPVEPEGSGEDEAPGQEEPVDSGDDPAATNNSVTVDTPSFDNVVMDGTFEVSRTPGTKVRVGVEGVYVSGPVMELRLVLEKLEGDGHTDVLQVLQETLNNPDLSLVDRVNLKRYFIMVDGSSNKLVTPWRTMLELNQPIAYQAFFAAPEDAIEAIDVVFTSGIPSFQDIPITYQD